MATEDRRFYPAKIKILSEDNPTMRVYIPREIVDYLNLKDGDTIGFMEDELRGEKMVRVKKLRF